MRVHVIQNEPGEYIGSMEEWFAGKGYILAVTKPYDHDIMPDVSAFDWLIVMGGGMSVNDSELFPWIEQVKNLINSAIIADKRVLGICLGGQLIASALGAKVYRNEHTEIGWHPIVKTSEVATWLPEQSSLLSWHGDCFEVPEGATPFAKSEITPCQGFCFGRKVWGLQFHLEAESTTPDIFLQCSGGSLADGPYIQDFDVINNSPNHCVSSKKIMHALLNVMGSA